jgi:flagellar protein FliS
VRLLYEGAIDWLQKARTCLQQGRIAERSAAISQAMEIILELQGSLDLERGGEIARALAPLYAYIQQRLAEANAKQQREPLEEALSLLMTLHQGWKDISAAPPSRVTAGLCAGADSLSCML